jgi:hypothetical protein
VSKRALGEKEQPGQKHRSGGSKQDADSVEDLERGSDSNS